MIEQRKYADYNQAVGQIKGRIVPANGVEVEKIDHRAKAQAVNNITDRPRNHQR